ncbi:MAG: hypothetical protein Q9191_005516 [Dirinaria sp. TL-2023a]
MPPERKYAALDAAPEIYETPELTDDTSTLPASTNLRSESPAPSYDEANEDEATEISRRHINPDEARTHFLSNDVEAKEARHTSRISSKRRFYKESDKRSRFDDPESVEKGLLSQDDDESLEKRLARLRREIAEVKAESERRNAESESQNLQRQDTSTHDIDVLSETLDNIASANHPDNSGVASRLVQQVKASSNGQTQAHDSIGPESDRLPEVGPTYTLSYAPKYQDRHTLAKVADFDSRLTLLETFLGIDTIALPTQGRLPGTAILPTLQSLDHQISVVSNSSDNFLDSTRQKIMQLAHDAENLTEARKSAKAALEALGDSQSSTAKPSEAATQVPHTLEDPEQLSKINALYGTLPTIESLSPLLPPLLDKLRSLRSLHAEAANASQNLAEVESRQKAMAEDLQIWREGLEKIEEKLKEGEQTMTGNMSTVEGWVKELEGRIGEVVQS